MYIVFEGIVGSGKTTQSKKLAEYLRAKYPDREVIHVREPGGTPIAEDIRTLAQAKEWDEPMHPVCNAYLYASARAQLLHTVVQSALEAGKIVIADRSFVTSLAYQGEAQGLGFDKVLAINAEAVKDVIPDKIIYMDIPVEISLSRTFDAVGDKWEKMGKEFFEKIVIGYRKASQLEMFAGKWGNIDAIGTPDEISKRILDFLGK